MKKRIPCLIFLIIISLIFSSCQNYEGHTVKTECIYNGLPKEWITFGQDRIYNRIENPANFTDNKSQKSYDLIRDPFYKSDSSARSINYIFCDNKNAYYLLHNNRMKYQIIRQNMETLSEDIIYEEILYNEQKDVFLGAAQTQLPDFNTLSDYSIPSRFAVFENSLFLFYTDKIKEINMDNKNEAIICNDGIYNGNYSYFNGTLFFITSSYDIFTYKISEKKLEKIPQLKAQLLLITPGGIYYSDASNKGCLCFIDFKYKNKKVLTDISVNAMDFDENYLYYLSEGDDTVYRMDLNSKSTDCFYTCHRVFDISYNKYAKTLCLLYSDSNGELAIEELIL